MTSTWEGMCSENTFYDYILPRRNLEVDRAIIQPKYVGNVGNGTVVFDIALLKLKDNLDLAEYTPACLPATNQIFAGETAWFYGWGRFENSNLKISHVLRQATQQVIASDICERFWREIPPDQLCALGQDQSPCLGDSGGPLTVEVDGRHILIGAASYVGTDVNVHVNGCAMVDIQ